MNRRAITSQVVIYALVMIMMGTILTLGFRFVSNLEAQQCAFSQDQFVDELQALARTTSANPASAVAKQMRAPCGIERVFFFDRDKEAVFNGMDRYPLMQNTLDSSAPENVFLIKEGEVYESLHVSDINVKVPYFLCTDANKGNLRLLMKSTHSGRVTLWPQEADTDCTYEFSNHIQLSPQDLGHTLGRIFDKNHSLMNKSPVDPIAAGLMRDIDYTRNRTIINVTKKNGTFEYYEAIPKCAIEDINEARAQGIISLNPSYDINLSDDPLIMWDFEEESSESVEYVINKTLSPECLRGHSPGLYGVGLASSPYPDGVDDDLEGKARKERDEVHATPVGGQAAQALEQIGDENAQERQELAKRLREVKEVIRRSSAMSQRERTRAVHGIQQIERLLKTAPREASVEGLSVLKRLPPPVKSNIDTNLLNESLRDLAHFTASLKREQRRHAGEDVSCTAGTDWCYDGVNYSQRCINKTAQAVFYCDPNVCGREIKRCTGGKVCVDGECVRPSSGCAERNGNCLNDTGRFRAYCSDDWNRVNYTCSGSRCVKGGEENCNNVVAAGGSAVCNPYEGECTQKMTCHIEKNASGAPCCYQNGNADPAMCRECDPVGVIGPADPKIRVRPVECTDKGICQRKPVRFYHPSEFKCGGGGNTTGAPG